MHRQDVALELAAKLYETETAVDAALGRAAELAALLPDARARANLSAVVGHDVVERATKTVKALTKARRSVVATHKGLEALRRLLRLDTVAAGPMEKPEEDTPRVPDIARLPRRAA